jgi:antirestriction protein ArdC
VDGVTGLTLTALHELTHWTKHERRLEWEFSAKRFGDQGYAREELVAEHL